MLTLLRKTRKSLINGGSSRPYLFYAIGEIALVVIGILIALQINNWNQERQNRQAESKLLNDLKQEFLINKERFEEKQFQRVDAMERFEVFLNLIYRNNANFQDYLEFNTGPIMSGFTNPSFGVINSLIASGDLKLISNDTLKYMLTGWKDLVGDLTENEQIFWDFGSAFRQFELEHMPKSKRLWKDWSMQELEENFDIHIKNIQYRNLIIRTNGGLSAAIDKCNIVLEELDRILRVIDRELGYW